MTWNAGSIGSLSLQMIENVPDSISGTIPSIVQAQTEKISTVVGVTVDSTGFEDKYFPAVLNYTNAEIVQLMSLQGSDASETKLGEFTVKKGKGSNLDSTAQYYEMKGDKCLDALGWGVRFKKSNGWLNNEKNILCWTTYGTETIWSRW